MKRKIFIKVIAFMTIMNININNVKPLELSQETTGGSYPVELSACVENENEGCGNMTQNFSIRVTIVDQNRNVVDGTKTIQFYTDDYYNFGNYWTYESVTDRNSKYYAATAPKFTAPGDEREYSFVGSSVAKINGERADLYTSSVDLYNVYLGFGKAAPEKWENSFKTYADNRKSFIKYATNLSTKKIGVEGQGKINFFDFVFNKTGFAEKYGATNPWKSSEDANILNKIANDKKKGIQYYFLIEPIYGIYMWQGGTLYEATGTAKQLAEYLLNNKSNLWFWPGYYYENSYNLVCNFIEKSGQLGFSTGDTSMCSNINNFKHISKNIELIEMKLQQSQSCSGIMCKVLEAVYSVSYKMELMMIDALQNNIVWKAYRQLADPNSVFGVNVINITESLSNNQPIPEYNNKCVLNISSCTDNDFKYETKLSTTSDSDGDLFDCIYPSNTNRISKNDMKNYSKSYEELDLWCYDDVSYSFTNLSEYFTNNSSPIKNNQSMLIPYGSLKVKRTCYTKRDYRTSGPLSISQVFETDDANYQDTFFLTLNGKKYKYERGQKYQSENQTKDNKRKTSNFDYTITGPKKTKINNNEYYEITSEFSYDYTLKDTKNTENPIGISNYDYNLTNSLSNNVISIPKNNTYNSNIIINQNTKTGKYLDELSTNESNFSTKINNGYGFTNALYQTLSKEKSKTQQNDINITETWEKKVTGVVPRGYTFNNIYIVNEKTSSLCAFKTEVENNGNRTSGSSGTDGVIFRVISLNNPFPARDGTSRLPGSNWLNQSNNNVYDYIENNRNVKKDNKDNNAETVYKKEPLYTITLTPSAMIKIREYNKSHNYSDIDMTCESKTGRMCIDNFIRDSKYIPELNGTCKTLTPKEVTEFNNRIREFELSGCNDQVQCMTKRREEVTELDTNKDGYVSSSDYLNADFYTCADKLFTSGG